MDLDLWDCVEGEGVFLWLQDEEAGGVKLIAKFQRTDLVICSYFREGKTLSYSQIIILTSDFALFSFISGQ